MLNALQPRRAPMPILFSDAFKQFVAEEPLVYVDAGARGGLEGPWATIADDRLHVVAFEPDAPATEALGHQSGPCWHVVAKALWSHEGAIPIHLAKVRPTSSVHPPNPSVLARYAARHSEPRETETVVSVPCISLDACLMDLGLAADFIKIDTQGSEYEILKGAENALRGGVFGVITETWTTEVHSGQKLTGDILTLMDTLGFTLFDVSIAAAWQRRRVDRQPLVGRPQVTGLDLLFFREPTAMRHPNVSVPRKVKAAAIAELYGFPDVALDLLSSCDQISDGRISALTQEIIAAATPPPASAPAVKAHPFLRWLRGKQKEDRIGPAKLHY